MKTRFAFVPALLLLSSLYTSQAVAQQPQQWSRTVLAPTVYSAGTDNSSFFSPSGMLPAATITNVTWNAGLYTGVTSQTVQLCFTPPYGSTPSCRDIRNELTGATTQFNGQNVRGSTFRITYNVQGGSLYPINPSFSNTLTVTYQ